MRQSERAATIPADGACAGQGAAKGANDAVTTSKGADWPAADAAVTPSAGDCHHRLHQQGIYLEESAASAAIIDPVAIIFAACPEDAASRAGVTIKVIVEGAIIFSATCKDTAI